MKKEKTKKTVFIVMLVLLLSSISRYVAPVSAFKDITNEVENAIDEFSEEGLFGSLIYKYGNDLFRPDGSITRADLLLVLKEYHIIITRLLANDKEIIGKMDGLESSGSSTEQVDMMIREFQKVLDPMLRSSLTVKKLKQDISLSSDKKEISEFNNEIVSLKEQVDEMVLKMDEMGKTPVSSSLAESSSQSTSLKKNSVIKKAEFNAIKEDVKKLKKLVAEHQKDMEKIAKKNGVLSYSAKAVNKSIKGSGGSNEALEKEISEIKKDLESMEEQIKEQEKVSKKAVQSTGSISTGISEGFPFWARLSIGFSTLVLFFMAR